MTPLHLTYEQAKADLLALAAERPDYVYEPPKPGDCMYFDPTTSQPSCIVGHVLARHGVTLSALRFHDVRANKQWGVSTLLANDVINVDAKTRRLLLVAQNNQDTGDPWLEAVAGGIESAEATW